MAARRSRGKHRIRVYGTQRTRIDPAALAQVLIAVGRDRHQRLMRRQQRRT
jgi:hypothetical protein